MTSFIAKNHWPSTKRAKQFFLFATRLRELVHPEAQDIYRVHAVSTIAKLEELNRCCIDVLNGRYPKLSLTPIIDEVNECLVSDIIIKKIVRTRRLPIENTKLEVTKSAEAIHSLTRLWIQMFSSSYEDELKKEIFLAINEPRLKKKLLICVKLYVSHLVYRGFKREFILEAIEIEFFERDIRQCRDIMLERFFSNFSREKREFTVALFGSEKAIEFYDTGESSRVASNADDLDAILGFKVDSSHLFREKQKAVTLKGISANNHYSALDKIGLIISLPESFGAIYPSPENLTLQDFCLVADNTEKSAISISRSAVAAPAHSFTSKLPYNPQMFHSFAGYLWSVTDNEDHAAFDRLQRSLEAANSALSTNSPASQLVSLWAAFEALLPPPPKDDKGVRITHFVEFIVPCIVRKYIRGKFRIFLDDVPRHSTGDISPILGEALDRKEKPRQLARVLLSDDERREALFSKVSDSPLLLQRLSSLGSLVTDPTRVRSKLKSHENRVRWQLFRIYRERNLIVHSGMSSDHLPVLVENLSLYYRLVIRALQQMHAKYDVYSPDTAFELVSALYFQKVKRLDDVLGDTSDRNFHKNFLDVIFED